MKTYEIAAEKRTDFGKSAAKRLRAHKQTPAAIYGGDEPVFITLDEMAFDKSLRHRDTFVYHIDLDGKTVRAILRDVEFHPVFDYPLHVDFLAVEEGKAQTVEIPVKLIGKPKGVEEGGILIQKLRKMKVKGDFSKIPEQIEVNVKELRLGHSLKVSNLAYDHLTIRNKPDVAVASVEIHACTASGRCRIRYCRFGRRCRYREKRITRRYNASNPFRFTELKTFNLAL